MELAIINGTFWPNVQRQHGVIPGRESHWNMLTGFIDINSQKLPVLYHHIWRYLCLWHSLIMQPAILSNSRLTLLQLRL